MAAEGIIPFARFMELALYCPQHGYYERKRDTVGQRGDFYTSVSVGPLFGEMLAFQFAGWLEPLAGGELNLVEAGAHDGRLAGDILSWLKRQRPALFERLDYVILEPSATRRAWQEETLAAFAGKITWQESLAGGPHFHGVIFSNELLDAFPVRRFGWDASLKEWFEWGVAAEGEKFAWARLAGAADDAVPAPPELREVLPDGFIVETCPAATAWWRQAAAALAAGKLMAIDYGLTAAELFMPERPRGTLRAYHLHRASDDLLANPGEQDLTAHVDFPAIQRAGESAGLATEVFQTQAQFLAGILERTMRDAAFGGWDAARLRQFQTLTHPEHLGRAFRVLVQAK
jgi:SAM-dependent MidA family methyltransferase